MECDASSGAQTCDAQLTPRNAADAAQRLTKKLCQAYINLDPQCNEPEQQFLPHCGPLYVFDVKFAPIRLSQIFQLPAWLAEVYRPHTTPAFQFALGPPCSSAPFHYHEDAWNYLAAGAKLWWLRPPVNATYNRQIPAREFLSSAARQEPGAGDIVCIQQQGDFMYVPRGWAHQTLNLQLGVGIAAEFTLDPDILP